MTGPAREQLSVIDMGAPIVPSHETMSHLTAYLQDVLGISGILLVKAFVKQRAEHGRRRALHDELRRLEIHAAMVSRWFRMLIDVMQAAAPGAVDPCRRLPFRQSRHLDRNGVRVRHRADRAAGPVAQPARE
jgi:hypothetical protein